jgi:glycosyltransferase involved in cell wall biosynthesis
MNFLVVSDREYKETSRGIDIITGYLAEQGHFVDHLVFFRRKKYPERQVTENIRQLCFYDPIKPYLSKLQFLFPGFILLAYFRHIIQKQSSVDFKKYDFVVLETGNPIYLAGFINTKIICRQSDPISITFNSNRSFYRKLETELIKRSFFTTSALDSAFFPPECKNKIIHWHSGFKPYMKINNSIKKKSFVIMGGELDWFLLNKIAKIFPSYQFNVIGISSKRPVRKNIIKNGYIEFDDYQDMVASALAIIVPFSSHYVYQLRQCSFTAKIFFSMQLGKPILLRAYGTIQDTDPGKKIYVYRTHKEALLMLKEIITKIECGEINYEVSKETQDFLTPQTVENRRKELEALFNRFLE